MSGTKKLDHLLSMNKLGGYRKGLGYVMSDTHVASPSKTTFIPASKKSSMVVNLEPRGKNILGEQNHKTHKIVVHRNQHPQLHTFEPRFIPTCHHCGALGHMKARYYKLVKERRRHNTPS